MENPSFINQIANNISFPFKDPAWVKKIAIGAGLSLAMFIVPIIPILLVSGYSRRIMRRVIVDGEEPALPEWVDWGKLLSEGLELWGAGMLFSLPVFLILIGSMTLLFFTMLSPIFFIRPDGTWPNYASLIYMGGFMLFSLSMILMTILSWVVSLLEAPALGHLVAKNHFSAAFQFNEWWPLLKKGIGTFLIAVVAVVGLIWVITFAMQILMVTIIAIFLLPFLFAIVMFLTNLFTNTFIAMAYRHVSQKLAPGA